MSISDSIADIINDSTDALSVSDVDNLAGKIATMVHGRRIEELDAVLRSVQRAASTVRSAISAADNALREARDTRDALERMEADLGATIQGIVVNYPGVTARVFNPRDEWTALSAREQAGLREAYGMAEAQRQTPETALAGDVGARLVQKGLAVFARRTGDLLPPDASSTGIVAWYIITPHGREVRRMDPSFR